MELEDIRKYINEDFEQYRDCIMSQAYLHICFECRKLIGVGISASVDFLGTTPIYHHTTCRFPEYEAQAKIEEANRKATDNTND